MSRLVIINDDGSEVEVAVQSPTYLAKGSTFPIGISDKLDESVSVTGWMKTLYDEEADHTDWLLNVIEKVHTELGGAAVGINFPHPTYRTSAKIQIPYDNIYLNFRGGGERRNSAANTRQCAASRIAFNPSAIPDVLLEWSPMDGSDFGVSGGGILGGVMLDGGNMAKRCLSVLSAHGLNFEGAHAQAATEAMIYTGCIDGSLRIGDYSSKGHTWQRCKAHAHNYEDNAAYALHVTGGQGAGGTDKGNTCFNTFESCEFTSRNNHAVRLENSDSNQFRGGSMASELEGFYGLEICSSSQSGGSGVGSARYTLIEDVQINDTMIRAGQSGGGSPQGIALIWPNFANAGGLVFVETAAGSSPEPEAVVFDRDGIRIIGDRAFNLDGMRAIFFTENIANPAPEPGKSKLYSGIDRALRLRRGDGSLGIAVPKPGVLAQTLQPLPNLSASQIAGLRTAGKQIYIPIDDDGTIRWIQTWTLA